ncbi:MAG: hypothetical protein AAB426_05125 [Myxococcota bacterium]
MRGLARDPIAAVPSIDPLDGEPFQHAAREKVRLVRRPAAPVPEDQRPVGGVLHGLGRVTAVGVQQRQFHIALAPSRGLIVWDVGDPQVEDVALELEIVSEIVNGHYLPPFVHDNGALLFSRRHRSSTRMAMALRCSTVALHQQRR